MTERVTSDCEMYLWSCEPMKTGNITIEIGIK